MHVSAPPLPPTRAASAQLTSGMLDTFSSLASDENRDAGVEVELAEDEEFAAEEHAHRCCLWLSGPNHVAPCGSPHASNLDSSALSRA